MNSPIETPASVAVPLPPATGTGPNPRGQSENQKTWRGWCERHGFLAAGCPYCADPVLEHEMYLNAQRVLDEFGRPW